MGPFFKKDIIVFWRDRKEMLIALLLPIVLIVVLNYAFSGLFTQDAESLNIDLAIVQFDDESVGLEQFKKTVQEKELSPLEKESMINQAEKLAPNQIINDFFNDPKLKAWVKSQYLSEEEATELVEKGELDAIIKIPEGLTYDMLSSIMFGEESKRSLIIQAEEQSNKLSIVQDMVTNFINTINLQFALGSIAESGLTEPELPQGGREAVEGANMFTHSQYFTIAIATLFAFFISNTVAIKTITEKRERVFNRIILANSKPLNFLMGKTLSTFCLSFIQTMIIFTVTQLLLDVFPNKSMQFWFGLLVVFAAFALSVAGLSALFTTITLNMNDSNLASGLFTLIIMGFGVLGGSFFPLQGLPELFQKMGKWTPNGLTQTVLIEWIQFGNLQDLILPVITLFVFFIVCFVIGIALFPRKGRI